MARPAARVGERLASLWDKFPIVARGTQGEFQNSERVRLSHFAVGFGTCETAVRVLASGTDHKLANASLKIKLSCRVLWGEALIVVVVSADYDFSVGRIERIPERFHLRRIPMCCS